ncbi:hypothetical protein PJL15_03585 [Paenarthrobacter nitroguajacolicus]|nr:hypothetical protein [Paenarthrobacter nitroguajacolicus]
MDSLGTEPDDGPCHFIVTMNPFLMMYAFRRAGLAAPHGAAAGWKPALRLGLSVSHL